MNEETRNKLPPIVTDYIDKLSGHGGPSFQKDLYCATLERVRDACAEAVIKYNQEKTKKVKS